MSDGAPLPPLCPGTPNDENDSPRYFASASTIGAWSCVEAMQGSPFVDQVGRADRPTRFTTSRDSLWEEAIHVPPRSSEVVRGGLRRPGRSGSPASEAGDMQTPDILADRCAASDAWIHSRK